MGLNLKHDLSGEVSKALKEYTTDVVEGIHEMADDLAKEALPKLKGTSPERSGDYRKGWRRKRESNKVRIHNKTDYQLTHLLEKGYTARNGKRVKPQVHIEPVEQEIIEKAGKLAEQIVRDGGYK